MSATSSTKQLLQKLRALMSSHEPSLSAYIVPSGDAHQSEYIADCDARREFISKFSGSAGTVVVTQDHALLWTDGRYHLQASKQLDLDYWTLMKDGLPDTPSIDEYLCKNIQSQGKEQFVGANPALMPHEQWERYDSKLKHAKIKLVSVRDDLIDKVWPDRPSRPCNDVICLGLNYTGKNWQDKVEELRKEMIEKKCGTIILTSLDDIAWLLNLRGSDIAFNPVFFAFAIVTLRDISLFIAQKKLTEEVIKFLNAPKDQVVNILPYEDFLAEVEKCVAKIKTSHENDNNKIWVSNKTPEAVYSMIPEDYRLLFANPVAAKKAIKNEVEIQCMKNAHVRDAAALIEYLAWLEKMIAQNPNGHDDLWEISGATYLENCRKRQALFQGLSFPSISSSGPNGAIIHYHPEESTKRPIGTKEMYLIDSGAQYMDGTTDVTRTVHFGEPTQHERECFTRVLKGHIQLALAIFPRKTKGASLDAFARRPLWKDGLEYLHGTGHGVGMFLNVHEGPCSISPRSHPDDTGLVEGMVLSNEPGYYEDGAFGIRIENLVVVKKANPKFNFTDRGFLTFETITLVPMQKKLIVVEMLTDEELEWLNEYHRTCLEVVGKHLDETSKPDVRQWLSKQTEQICKN